MNTRLLATSTLALSTLLALTGCGSNSLSAPNTTAAAAPSKAVAVDPALAARLPEKIKSAKKIVVGTEASYAPNEFLDADGKTIIGADVDVFNAVAAKLGVTVEWQAAQFDSLITGVQGKKYDAVVASYTINAKRLEQVNMVSYYKAGTSWAVAAGNPKKVDPDNICGKTVAVQTGTAQADEDLPARQAKCAGNPINVLNYEGQDQATAAVVSGKADASLADSPIVAYAVKQSGGKLETVGQLYDAAPYGVVVAKEQTEFAQLLADAFAATKADGSYDAALTKWGTQNGGVSTFTLNPKG